MSDAISRLLVEREALEHGLPATLLLSVSAHVALVGAAVILPMLLPQEPLLGASQTDNGYIELTGYGGNLPLP